jgi:glycosyltransferase involved in cell wall biosynthesis
MLYLHENEISRKWNKGTKNIVSICCITYNHEKYIERAIDGFLLQDTDFPFEIVIGNDCSTDRTTQILNSYEAMYPNIVKVIHNKKNIGMMKNFLQTLHACSGEYIAVCEGDDYWINRNKL